MTVGFGHTSLKKSTVTAGVAWKTDGNGSPATGPGVTGKIECADVSGGKGAAYQRAVLSKVLAQGYDFFRTEKILRLCVPMYSFETRYCQRINKTTLREREGRRGREGQRENEEKAHVRPERYATWPARSSACMTLFHPEPFSEGRETGPSLRTGSVHNTRILIIKKGRTTGLVGKVDVTTLAALGEGEVGVILRQPFL